MKDKIHVLEATPSNTLKSVPELLSHVEKIINGSIHRALGNETPLDVVNLLTFDHAKLSNTEEVLAKVLEKQLLRNKITTVQQQNADYEIKRHASSKTVVKFEVGDEVLVAIPPKLRGPLDKNLYCRKGTVVEVFGVNARVKWGETGGMYKGLYWFFFVDIIFSIV